MDFQWLVDLFWKVVIFCWELLVWIFEWILKGFLQVFLKLLGYIFITVLEGFLTIVYGVFAGLDFSSAAFTSASSSWSNIPSQLIWLITQLGLPQCFSMVVTALSIRLLLNLIPATLTRI